VGMACRVINALEKALDPSIRAARAVGPNTGIPTIAYTQREFRKMGSKWMGSQEECVQGTFAKIRLDSVH